MIPVLTQKRVLLIMPYRNIMELLRLRLVLWGAGSDLVLGYKDGKYHSLPLCEGFYTYAFLQNRIRYNGEVTPDDIGRYVSMIKENPDGVACLKQEAIDAGMAEGKRLYEAWKTKYDEQERPKKALYDKAKARMPEVKAAYEMAVRAQQEGN